MVLNNRISRQTEIFQVLLTNRVKNTDSGSRVDQYLARVDQRVAVQPGGKKANNETEPGCTA
jgi:hypothetical protein